MRYVAALGGIEHEVELDKLDAHSFSISLGGQKFEVDLRKVGPTSFSVLVNQRAFDFEVIADNGDLLVTSRNGSTRLTLIDPARRLRNSTAGARQVTGKAELKAMMPGRVINVLVAVGDQIAAGQSIMVVEAMKMENELKAPKAGKVIEVKVAPGQTVEKGDSLMIIE